VEQSWHWASLGALAADPQLTSPPPTTVLLPSFPGYPASEREKPSQTEKVTWQEVAKKVS
jgi:hypothetical protein